MALKTAILTLHRCINYGSYWQAYCLAEGLKKRGYEVTILNHYSKRVNMAEWKCALQPVLPTPVPKSDYPLYRQKIENFFDAFNLLPLSSPFPLEDPSKMDEFYDLVIVGSDEVWNLSHPWYGYYPIFYGEGIRAKRLISYAASFGNYDVTWKPDQQWVNKLYKFDNISVRDENSQIIIKNVLGFEPEAVLDPCLQFTVKSEKLISEKKPFAAVYGHNFSDFFIRNILEWAKKSRLRLISIGYRNDWAHEQKLTTGPLEFASYMAQAEAVITNFFHGCIFALINSKPFVCETSKYRNHKIQDLMKKIGAIKHIANGYSAFDFYAAALSLPLDESILKRIAYLRKVSDAYLDQALKENILNYENHI